MGWKARRGETSRRGKTRTVAASCVSRSCRLSSPSVRLPPVLAYWILISSTSNTSMPVRRALWPL